MLCYEIAEIKRKKFKENLSHDFLIPTGFELEDEDVRANVYRKSLACLIFDEIDLVSARSTTDLRASCNATHTFNSVQFRAPDAPSRFTIEDRCNSVAFKQICDPPVPYQSLMLVSSVENGEAFKPLLADGNGRYKIAIVGNSGSGKVFCMYNLLLLEHGG